MTNTTNRFEALLNEVEVIQAAWHYGALEALEYIASNWSQYEGTAVARQYRAFMAEGQAMMTPI